MKGQFSYQDFDLLIEPAARGRYRARVLRSPAGESAPVPFKVPFSPVELENFVLKVGLARRGTRGRPESAPLKDFGGKLYTAVFQDELRDRLLSSLSLTRAPGAGLRLRLRLVDAPELAELPWEFLYDPRLDRFLAQSRRTPLVRYLDLPDAPHPLAVDGPLRLLVMISSPTGYPALDVDQEWRLLSQALAEQQEEGRVIVERVAANMGTLRRRLRREEFHMFHFVGHGLYRPDWGDGVLVMEDRNGLPHEVTGDELGRLLNEYNQTRLAVLNACEGARSSAHDPFAGVAQRLIQQGLPAVVAMQFAITDDAAIIFAEELYAAVADGYPLEAALAEARGAISDEAPTEWGTPVLYSRAPDGRLFDLAGPARVSEAKRRTREEADPQAREGATRQAQEDAHRKAQEELPHGEETKLAVLADTAQMTGAAANAAGARDQRATLPPQEADGSAGRPFTIFINYRHEDTPAQAAVLHMQLEKRFGPGNVFYDRSTPRPGTRWLEEIKSHLAAGGVFIALIGPAWMSAMTANLRSGAEDPVAKEIDLALRSGPGVTVIPVLTDDADLPGRDELPTALRGLPDRQAERLRNNNIVDDIDRLIARLEEIYRFQAAPGPGA